MKYAVVCTMLLLAASAQAGMLGDPVTSILHTASNGSWPSGSATVGPGIEFSRMVVLDPINGLSITLDITDTSFSFNFDDTGTTSFSFGLDGFEFTDLNQNFAGIALEPGNKFPAGILNGSSVTPNTIHIFMNEGTIFGGAAWNATWDVTFASQVPEPGTLPLTCVALLSLTLLAWRKRSIPSDKPRHDSKPRRTATLATTATLARLVTAHDS